MTDLREQIRQELVSYRNDKNKLVKYYERGDAGANYLEKAYVEAILSRVVLRLKVLTMHQSNDATDVRYKDKDLFDKEVRPFLEAQRDYDQQQIGGVKIK